MDDSRYHTLGRRIVASLIDIAIFLPLAAVFMLAPLDPNGWAFWTLSLITFVVSTCYYVILHGRTGQTVGKKVMGVTVVSAVKEESITMIQSVRRESPFIVMYLVLIPVEAVMIEAPDELYYALLAFTVRFDRIMDCWFLADPIVALLNQRRRTLHDFVGSTVVVKPQKANQPPQTMPTYRPV